MRLSFGRGLVVVATPVTLVLWALILWSTGAFGQGIGPNPVTTLPYTGAVTANASGAIAVTNTFQSVFAAPTGNQRRFSCTIQNNSATNPMFVFFGPIANATLTNSLKLAPGASASCVTGGTSLQDQVSITGTALDAFYAVQQ